MLRVADPHLGPIDDVIIFVFFSTRLQRKGITPRLCFREAEASNLGDRSAGKTLQQTQRRIFTARQGDLQYYKCSDQQFFQLTIKKVKINQCHNKVTECQIAHHVC